MKLRLHSSDWRLDLPVVEAVREAVGADLEIMVDANQGWRMPGDLTPRWDVATAREFAAELERLGVYWLEEPLDTDDVEGYADLCGRYRPPDRRRRDGADGSSRARSRAPGRGRRHPAGRRPLRGYHRARRIAALAEEAERIWSPHTWSNGYGLLANLHAALAFSTCPYLEVPFDPPAWSADRRDWLLPVTSEIAGDGTIAPPPGPGLGVVPDLDALEQYRVA